MEESREDVVNEEKEDEGNVITLEEFIEEETRLETDAQAVLGPLDDKTCTYNQGYMGRQALYACKTCKGQSNQTAAVCLACTYHCHEGHDLIELYTKRNYRCDCGNSRFKDNKCNLEATKDSENVNNRYNHNFEGLYCTCERPYPDPEDSVPDEMIQCVICEDWYHTRHLNAELPGEENYAEMICTDCTARLSFLNKYLGFAVTKVIKDESHQIDVGSIESSLVQSHKPCDDKANGDSTQQSSDKANVNSTQHNQCGDNTQNSEIGDVKLSDHTNSQSQQNNDNVNSGDKMNGDKVEEENNTSVDSKSEGSGSCAGKLADEEKPKGCLLESLKEIVRERGATFWPHNFRTLLCTCVSCKEMYSRLEVGYLIDLSDTVQAYEDKGRSNLLANSSSSDENKHSLNRVLSMLNNIGMDRFSQAEAILNYNDLKSNLMTYLSKFAENKKVVREEDIHEFFTQMKARKRQKLDQGPTFSCR